MKQFLQLYKFKFLPVTAVSTILLIATLKFFSSINSSSKLPILRLGKLSENICCKIALNFSFILKGRPPIEAGVKELIISRLKCPL